MVAACTLKSEPVDAPDGAALDARSCAADWWDTSFTRRQQLSLAPLTAPLADFSALVALDPERFDYDAARADGDDLRFVTAAGAELPFEVERWATGDSSTLWVKLPTTDEPIHIYYGNPAAVAAADPAAVWTGDYAAVWHFRDDPGGVILDSTSNAHTGTRVGAPTPAEGRVGPAVLFDGVDDYIDVAGGPAFAAADVTLEALVNLSDPTPVGFLTIFEHDRQGTNWYGLWRSGSGPGFHLRYSQAAAQNHAAPAAADTWYYVAGTIDSANATVTLYLDGAVDTEIPMAAIPTAAAGPVQIGVAAEDPLAEFFPGLIDEIRVSTTARTGEWIAAQNLSLTDQLISFGQIERCD